MKVTLANGIKDFYQRCKKNLASREKFCYKKLKVALEKNQLLIGCVRGKKITIRSYLCITDL